MTVTHRLVILAVAVSLLGAACSGDGGTPFFGVDPGATSTTSASGSTSDGSAATTSPAAETTMPPETTTTTTLPPGPQRPLPLMEGLATFDSFEWTMGIITVGPTAAEYTDISTTLYGDRTADTRRSTMTSTMAGPDYDGVETSTQESWQDPTGTCSYDGSEYSFEVITAQQREMLDVVTGLFDVQVTPEFGTEVGPEPIAGVPAMHYSYVISGLGSDSGALVTENQVDYWLADDTGALVKYSLVAETRSGPVSDPTSEVYRVEATAELRAANGPVDVAFPAACEALRPEDDGATGEALEAGSRIVVKIGGDSVGVLSGTPVCTIEETAGSRSITVLVDGRIDGTRYRVSIEATGPGSGGEYEGAAFGLIVGSGSESSSTGEGPVTVTYLDGGLVTLEFNAGLQGAGGKDRLRGSVTCAGA